MRIATLLLIFAPSIFPPAASAQSPPLPLEIPPQLGKREYHDIVVDPADAARVVPLDRYLLRFESSIYRTDPLVREDDTPAEHFAARNILSLVEIVPAERIAYFGSYDRVEVAIVGWVNTIKGWSTTGEGRWWP